MEEELNFPEVPLGYSVCLNQQCPKASTCLRRQAEINMPDSVTHWSFISLKHLAAIEGECRYYRPCQKIRLAKGFIGILNKLPHKQMLEIVGRLIYSFKRRTYYRVRKGERPLSPDEQQIVRDILKRYGVNESWEFDSYYDSYDW